MTACTLFRPFVIIHHLSHSSGYTTGNATLGLIVFRAKIVVRRALIPTSGYKSLHRSAVVAEIGSLSLGKSRSIIINSYAYFLSILAQPPFQLRIDVIDVEIALVAVTEHLVGAVVTCHDGKSVALVEYVVQYIAVFGGCVSQLWFGLCASRA